MAQQNENPEEKSAGEVGGEPAAQLLKFAVADFTDFLAERPDDPAVASAVYDLTDDRSYLLECLRKWPASPDLLSRAALGESDPEEKLRYAERLIQASPEHSLGYYQKAVALLKLGKADLAADAMDHALPLSLPVVDDQRTINLRRQALEYAGRSADEVRICSLMAGRSVSCLIEDLRAFIYPGDGIDDAATDVGPERVIAMAEHVIQVPAPFHWNQAAGMSVQRAMLEKLDPDMLFGDTGKTVGEQLQSVSNELSTIQTLQQEAMKLEGGLSQHEFALYMDDVMALGWRKAFESLRDKTQQK